VHAVDSWSVIEILTWYVNAVVNVTSCVLVTLSVSLVTVVHGDQTHVCDHGLDSQHQDDELHQ